MKLFLIIYAGTQIGGVIGPLPITEAQCLDHAGKLNAESQLIASTGKNAKGDLIPEKNRMQIATMRAACEWHDTRPALQSPAYPSTPAERNQHMTTVEAIIVGAVLGAALRPVVVSLCEALARIHHNARRHRSIS